MLEGLKSNQESIKEHRVAKQMKSKSILIMKIYNDTCKFL